MDFKMAWRNLWRNKRRSGLAIAVIAFGVTALVVFISVFNGLHEEIIKSSVKTFTGYIQINRKGYFGHENLDAFIENPDSIIKDLEKIEHVKSITSRILSPALLSHKDNSVASLVIGISPKKEKEVTIFYRGIKKDSGRFLTDDDDNSIIIGKDMAKRLQVTLNGEITVLIQSITGSLEAINCEVVGIFDCGNLEFNQNIAMVNIKKLAEVIEYKTDNGFKVSSIILDIDRDQDTNKVKENINKCLKKYKAFSKDIEISEEESDIELINEFGDEFAKAEKSIAFEKGFEVLGWRKILPDIEQLIKLDQTFVGILLAIVFLAVFLIIFNVMMMSIFERTREFGIMMAIGTKPIRIIKLVFFESVILSIFAAIIGCILGTILCVYFYYYPLDLGDISKVFSTGMLKPSFKAYLSIESFVQPLVVTIITSILIALLCSWKISQLKPIEAIYLLTPQKKSIWQKIFKRKNKK